MTTTSNPAHSRDRRLRRRILLLLDAAKVKPDSGWAGGRFIFDLLESSLPPSEAIEDDAHLTGLLRDLVGAEYAQERDDRTRLSQRAALEFTSFRITPRGTALLAEQIEPDPLVEDGRIRAARRA